MPYNSKYNEKNYEYRKNKIKRIPLDVKIEKYEEIAKISNDIGETVNGFIKTSIDKRIAEIKKFSE